MMLGLSCLMSTGLQECERNQTMSVGLQECTIGARLQRRTKPRVLMSAGPQECPKQMSVGPQECLLSTRMQD